MTGLVQERDVLRVRLSEAQWRTAYDAAGAPAGLGALGPQVVQGEGPVPDETTLAAVRDLAGAPVRVQVASSHGGGSGLVGGFAVRPEAVVSLTRVVGGAGGRMGAVPGVELSAYTPDVLVEELLRLLPEASDRWRSREPLVLPPEDARTLVRAVRTGDRALLAATLELLGLEEVPPLVEQLLEPRGDATVVMTRDDGGTRYLRLLLTDRGWLRLALEPGRGLVHAPWSVAEVAETLTTTLAVALRPRDVAEPEGER